MIGASHTYTYLPSGSILSNILILFSYIANTIPPLNINLPNLITAPLQSFLTPSSFTILVAQCQLFRYNFFASILCIRVFTVSIGCVEHTVTIPAIPPMQNAAIDPGFSPGAKRGSYADLRKLYMLKRTALFADWRSVVGTRPAMKPRRPRSRAMTGTACRKPRSLGLADFLSSILRALAKDVS